MWLEIADNIVIGVHSDRCDNQNTWVEYEGEAKPGDKWRNDRVIPFAEKRNTEKESRVAARNRITEFYPEWRQLNILREGNDRKIASMGKFIDACRKWSNDENASINDLEKIKP